MVEEIKREQQQTLIILPTICLEQPLEWHKMVENTTQVQYALESAVGLQEYSYQDDQESLVQRKLKQHKLLEIHQAQNNPSPCNKDETG